MNLEIVLIISFVFISLFGTLLHFTHGWFKNGILLHIFSAINESTWEHMKLLVAPTVFIGIFQYIVLGSDYPNIFNSIFILLFVQICSIPLLYEPLRVLVDRVHFIITIMIFYLSISLGIFIEYIFLIKGYILFDERISLIFILLLTFLFGIFTYYPPRVSLFKDPNSGKYGEGNRK
ncbi:MAG: DUF6512 family protein [Candidatus Dojkabacteria bacterium]|jgi:hypothetical protein|nr:DUF6512 family protein [Candidatus Dojkabacteria bacterium]